MRRLLLPLLLALVLAGAPQAARAEDDEPASEPIDPAVVGRLLMSPKEEERARGIVMLRERVARGGDVQSWLSAMAQAQASWADDEGRLTERWIEDVLHGAPGRAERAQRLIVALGREATLRLRQVMEAFRDKILPGAAAQPAPAKEETPAPTAPAAPAGQVAQAPQQEPAEGGVESTADTPQAPPAPPAVPVAVLRATVIEVPNREILDRFVTTSETPQGAARGRLPELHDDSLVLRDDAEAVLQDAAVLPEARTRRAWSDEVVAAGRPVTIADGDPVRYRSRAKKTKGAWAVATDTLRRGLIVSFLLPPGVEPDADGRRPAVVVARYVTVPDPLPTEQVRPADDVEPIEIDRPEWEAASMRVETRIAVGGDEVAAFFPGLVPDKVVVVGLRLLPIPAPQAADATR